MTGLRQTLVFLTAAAMTLIAAPAHASAAGPITAEVTLDLGKDGVLHVSEKISGATGEVKRTLLTRTRYDDDNDRLYQVSNLKGGTQAGDVVTMKSPGTLTYDVKGAISPSGDLQELRWFAVSGWDSPSRRPRSR